MNWAEYLNIAQALGIFACILELFSFGMKNDRRQIIFRVASSAVWIFHYHGLGKWVPAIMVGLDFVRYGSALYIRLRPRLIYPMLILFSILYVGLAYAFKTEWMDLLPGVVSIFSCYCIFALRGVKMRIAFMWVMAGWCIYDLYIHSVGGVINNMAMLGINAVTIYRLTKKPEEQLG